MRRSFALSTCSRAGVECCSNKVWHRLDFLVVGSKLLGFLSFAAFSGSLSTTVVQQLLWPLEIGRSQWLAQHGVSLG